MTETTGSYRTSIEKLEGYYGADPSLALGLTFDDQEEYTWDFTLSFAEDCSTVELTQVRPENDYPVPGIYKRK